MDLNKRHVSWHLWKVGGDISHEIFEKEETYLRPLKKKGDVSHETFEKKGGDVPYETFEKKKEIYSMRPLKRKKKEKKKTKWHTGSNEAEMSIIKIKKNLITRIFF